MKFTPHPYQQLIQDWIFEHPRCRIFAEMGLGKTVSVLTALWAMHVTGELKGPVLVIAPRRVALTTWPDEIEKWDHLKKSAVAIPILGSASQRKEILRRYLPRFNRSETRMQVFTINYDNLVWLKSMFPNIDNWPFKTVVADEDTKLKSFRTKQGGARAAALGQPLKQNIVHHCVDRYIGLTGTPSPNGLQDLWGPTWMVDKGFRLGCNFEAFKERWFTTDYNGFSIRPLPNAQKDIESRLTDVCLSVRAKDYFPVEKPIIKSISVVLPPKAMQIYREMEREMFVELEQEGLLHEVEAFSAAAKTIKCLQLANGAAYVGDDNKEWAEVHDEKIEALREIVEEACGMPVLVAYHFKSDLARLKKAFPQGRELDNNPETQRLWNEGKIPVLFAHPASAGHGLNLQYGSNILAFFGHWWDLEQYQQIIERIGPVRQKQAGFDRPVFVYHIVARGTIDETVMARRDSKKSVQEILMEALKKKEGTHG